MEADGSGNGSVGGPQPGLEQRLADARVDLYRPGAGFAQRSDYEQLRAAVVAMRRTLPPIEVAHEVNRRRARQSLALVALLGLTVYAGVLVAANVLVPSRSAPQTAIGSGGSLVVALRSDPGVLAPEWRSARVVAASDALDGARPLVADMPGALLLVVRCPSSDRSFEASVTAASGVRAETVYGACGRLQQIELTAHGLRRRVVVTSRGVQSFSAVLFVEPAARSVTIRSRRRHDRLRA